MAAYKHFLGILALALIAEMALSADHTVRSPRGSWDLITNQTASVGPEKFVVNDNLIFKYPANFHNVLEVTKSNYESCGLNSPIKTYAGGDNTIKLTSAGTRYFVCGISNHCKLGMKLQINTVAASAPTPASPSTPTSPPPQLGPATPTMMMPPPAPSIMTPPPASTPSGGNSLQVTAASGTGFGFGLLMLLAF